MATAWLLVFIASFAFIGLKAAQQRAVAWQVYWVVPLVGAGLAAVEFYVIVVIAQGEPWVILPLWLGGSSGCLCSMWLTRRWGGS